MEVVRILGKRALNGTVHVSGAKNACLPIFAATLLTEEPCIIENVPNLSDIRFMGEILQALGAEVEQLDDSTWRVFARTITHTAPYELVRKMRASICAMGPLVGRLRRASISLPGGCVIGHRPIDLHLKGLEQLGCKVDITGGYIEVDGERLEGNEVFLGGRYGSTVTGTANLLMAAVLAPGVTVIESAACEPEIIDLCHMLVSMGAIIQGIGSPTLTIEGVERLSGCRYRVIPDRIEAGTFIIAGLMTEGTITVQGARADHLHGVLHTLRSAGAKLEVDRALESVTISGSPKDLSPIEVITLPYPGFPTDLQAQMTALMTCADGLSVITERIYPNRFMHLSELQRMGADIRLEGASSIISGGQPLSGAPLMASDLRASAALYLAGLAAEGETWVQRIYHLDRGYEGFDEKLRNLGADITRMPIDKMPKHLNPQYSEAHP